MPPFGLRGEVKQAHIAGSYGIAFDAAREDLDSLSFSAGFPLVLDAADGADLLYFDAISLVWLEQGIRERRLTLVHLGWAAQRLHDLWDYRRRGFAETALRRFLAE